MANKTFDICSTRCIKYEMNLYILEQILKHVFNARSLRFSGKWMKSIMMLKNIQHETRCKTSQFKMEMGKLRV